jgi:hypothetical protein
MNVDWVVKAKCSNNEHILDFEMIGKNIFYIFLIENV